MAAKYLVLTAELRRLCARLRRQGKTKLPGETALAEQFGCSRQTVRGALALLEREGLIVRARGSGTYLADAQRRRDTRIAVLVCSEEDYLYPQLLRDIEAVCAPEGFKVERFATGDLVAREREILARLLERPPAGVIIEGAKSALPSPNLDLLGRIGALDIPLVWLHSPLSAPENAPCIQDDNEGGARLLVRHLAEAGHRRIAGVFKSDDRQGLERYQGFVSELLRTGCEVAEEHVFWYDAWDREALLDSRGDWLDRFIRDRLSPCTAVVCYNDEIAYPLIRRLGRAGLRVPEDVAVVSFDDSHYCRLSPVTITSLAHERHQMGSAAAHALLSLIDGGSARSLRLTWALRERESG